jgi:hypothetical protein
MYMQIQFLQSSFREALSMRRKPAAQLLAEAGMGLSVGDRTMYARIAVEEDDAMLLEEIVWCGDM